MYLLLDKLNAYFNKEDLKSLENGNILMPYPLGEYLINKANKFKQEKEEFDKLLENKIDKFYIGWYNISGIKSSYIEHLFHKTIFSSGKHLQHASLLFQLSNKKLIFVEYGEYQYFNKSEIVLKNFFCEKDGIRMGELYDFEVFKDYIQDWRELAFTYDANLRELIYNAFYQGQFTYENHNAYSKNSKVFCCAIMKDIKAVRLETDETRNNYREAKAYFPICILDALRDNENESTPIDRVPVVGLIASTVKSNK